MILGDYLTSREMRAVEMNAEYLGVSRLQLMENAGQAIAEEVKRRLKPGSKVAIFCGLGGNGGDGFVAARHLARTGNVINVFIIGSSSSIRSKEARINFDALKNMSSSIIIENIHDSMELRRIKADVVIDALFGTGIRGDLLPPFNEVVRVINESDAFIIAVDVPSGIESDSGDVHGTAVKANLTLTFHKPKAGFQKAKDYLGDLKICPIGIPPEAELFAGPGDVFLVSRMRLPESHKGDYGRLLVIGGSEIYSGAPALTGLGAYAAGVDLVYVAAPESVASIIAGFSPSLITVKLKGSHLTSRNIKPLKDFLEKIDVVVMGPGLGLHSETLDALNTLFDWIENRKLPLLLDADALKGISLVGRKIKTTTVYTPHSQEFYILTGREVKGNFEERGNLVKEEALKIEGTILLKGNVDVISNGIKTRFNFTGNPGMTVGGTGDVLSGVVSALMAKGVPPLEAAVAGAFINGVAGDLAFVEKGYHLIPLDLVERIPEAIEGSLASQFKAK